MNKDTPYIKHVYWLGPEEEVRLREELASEGITLKSGKGIVCAPLDPINKVTSIAPEVWNETCARQGSWYRESTKDGLYLVVSAFDLPGCEHTKAAVITESDFVPPRRASDKDTDALFADPQVNKRIPKDWKKPGEREKRIYLRWARKMGSDEEDYDTLYVSHTANHGNFIHPRLFVEDEDGIIPYSMYRTSHLCSCCVELFQILGEEYSKKLVAPCPGAVIFSRLQKDRFLLVERA